MAEEDKKKSFWETLPGIITALGGLLMGVAAVIAALNSGGKEGAAKTETPAAQVAPAVPPSAAPAPDDEAARRAKEEAEAAKAALAQANAEKAAAEARAEEAERRAAVIEAARKAADDEQAKAQPAALKKGDITTDGFTGMKLAYVPGGCFMMGSSADDKDHQDDEGPVHEVCVDSFWMGQFEVTQGQWEKVMGTNPSKFNKGGNYPVERVSWNDAQEFINKLNSRTGKQYRLPTEAEWEYACRANSTGKYCGGDDVDAVAWHDKNSGETTHAVGEKRKNGFDLYDMSGNVWEWCADWYDSGYYASCPKDNPQGPDRGGGRVLRGGSSFYAPLYCRAVYRSNNLPAARGDNVGFRLVLPFQ